MTYLILAAKLALMAFFLFSLYRPTGAYTWATLVSNTIALVLLVASGFFEWDVRFRLGTAVLGPLLIWCLYSWWKKRPIKIRRDKIWVEVRSVGGRAPVATNLQEFEEYVSGKEAVGWWRLEAFFCAVLYTFVLVVSCKDLMAWLRYIGLGSSPETQ